MPSTQTARTPRWRGLAAAVAVVLLIGNVLSLLHHVVVRHAVCVEHGESVHVLAGSDGDVGDHAYAGPPGQDASIAVWPTRHPPSESTHSHCDVWACAPRAANVAADPTLVEAPELEAEALVTQVAVLGRSRDLLFRLAPKNSPPDLRT